MLLNRNSIHCASTILTRTQTKNSNKMSPLLTVHVPFFYLSFPFSNFSRVHARWNILKSSGDNHKFVICPPLTQIQVNPAWYEICKSTVFIEGSFASPSLLVVSYPNSTDFIHYGTNLRVHINWTEQGLPAGFMYRVRQP